MFESTSINRKILNKERKTHLYTYNKTNSYKIKKNTNKIIFF